MIRIIEGTVFIDDLEEFLRKLKATGKEKNMVIQAFDADKLAGEEHLRFAVEKAISSFERGANIAGEISKEIMLYAAGTRQISRAMRIGVHAGRNNIAIVAIGDAPDLSGFGEITPAQVLQYDSTKKDILMDIFNITEEELEAVGEEKIPELVLERVALVDVLK